MHLSYHYHFSLKRSLAVTFISILQNIAIVMPFATFVENQFVSFNLDD